MLKKILIFASLLCLTHFCYSLSIDLDELQNNPYFKDDLNIKLEEEEKQKEAERAEAEEKFLQEGLEEAARKEAEAAEEEAKNPPYVPTEGNEDIHDEKDYHGFNIDDVENLENPEDKSTKENKNTEPDTTIKDKNINISFGYNALYILPVGNKILENLLGPQNISSFNFAGAAVKTDWMFLPYLLGLNGFGLKQTWNLFYKKGANYKLFANFLTTDIYFTHKMQIAKSHHIFEFYIGAGFITFVKPEFVYTMKKYKDNNTKEIETFTRKEKADFSYFYPSASAGIAVQFYIKRNIYIDVDTDFTWPFLTDDPFPVIEATICGGWHF